MDRRAFLATGAALPLAGSASAASIADPIVEIFARWETAKREWCRLADLHDDWDRPEMLALAQEEDTAFFQMVHAKAESLDGLRCQITVIWETNGPNCIIGADDCEHEQASHELRLLCNVLLGAQRLSNAPAWESCNSQMLSPNLF